MGICIQKRQIITISNPDQNQQKAEEENKKVSDRKEEIILINDNQIKTLSNKNLHSNKKIQKTITFIGGKNYNDQKVTNQSSKKLILNENEANYYINDKGERVENNKQTSDFYKVIKKLDLIKNDNNQNQFEKDNKIDFDNDNEDNRNIINNYETIYDSNIKHKIKNHFFQKISFKKNKNSNTKTTNIDNTNTNYYNSENSNSKQVFISNLYELFNLDNDYYITKKLSFIVLLKASAIAFYDYMTENCLLPQERRLSIPAHNKMNKYEKRNIKELLIKSKSLLPLNQQRVVNKNTVLMLNPDENRFFLTSIRLEEAPNFNILPIMDDIEIKYLTENELKSRVNNITLLEENEIYIMYIASYEVNSEKIISLFDENKSNNSLNSTINQSTVILKVYKSKTKFQENINYIYRNYYKNILRPDEILIVDNTQYLIYKKKCILLQKADLKLEEFLSITRQFLLFYEYSHKQIKAAGYRLFDNSVLYGNNYKNKYDKIIYIHEFSGLEYCKDLNNCRSYSTFNEHNNKTDFKCQFKNEMKNDLIEVGSFLYKFTFGFSPDLNK